MLIDLEEGSRVQLCTYITADESAVDTMQLVSNDRSASDARSHVGSSHDSTKSKCHRRSLLCVFLVHGQVTIIFVVSVCLSVCLLVCLFVRLFVQFFSAVFDPISIKLGHVICLDLVVSPRGCATPGCGVTPKNWGSENYLVLQF